MADSVFLRRVLLKNYKSIAGCSVNLGPLNFLAGPNGAGKGNFLDALRFVTESLNTSLDRALRERGGIAEVRHRSSGHPIHFGIRLEFTLPSGSTGYYAFRVSALPGGGFRVYQEKCRIHGVAPSDRWFYEVESGHVIASHAKTMPPALSDQLFLVAASGLPEFRPLYDALTHMGFYNLNADVIRELQTPDAGDMLRRDGSNLASVLSVMKKKRPQAKDLVVEFLGKLVPGVQDVSVRRIRTEETLEFKQKVGDDETPWTFLAKSMSEGTLRVLGILTALFQSMDGGDGRVSLVGIAEPEVAVHPGAAGILRDALRTAAANTQVVVTSHSPDLLEDKDVGDESILGVVCMDGETKIGPLKETERHAARDHRCTAGELLRLGQLAVDIEKIGAAPADQLELFRDCPS